MRQNLYHPDNVRDTEKTFMVTQAGFFGQGLPAGAAFRCITVIPPACAPQDTLVRGRRWFPNRLDMPCPPHPSTVD